MLPFINIDFIVIVIALIVSLIAVIEKKEPSRFFLAVLLSFLAIINGGRLFNLINLTPTSNLVATNLSMLIEMAFYFLIFYFLLEGRYRKNIMKLFFVIYLAFAIINALYIQPLDDGYSNYSFVIGSFFILVSILFYFKEQLQGDGYRRIFKNFWMWYAAALFIFLATEIPVMSILNYLLHTHASASAAIPVMKLKIIVSSFYYLSLSTAYILCRNKT